MQSLEKQASLKLLLGKNMFVEIFKGSIPSGFKSEQPKSIKLHLKKLISKIWKFLMERMNS
jgi:hypothetical protein